MADEATTEEATTEATTEATSEDAWYSGIENEDIRGAASKFESEQAFHDAIGLEVDGDWRAGIKDEKLRDHAGRFTTVEDLAKGHLDLRSQLSKAIVPPGKDAKPEAVASYRKAMGIPEEPDGYELPAPAEGDDLTEDMKAYQSMWRDRVHQLNIPSETAKALAQMVADDTAKQLEAETVADKQFADKAEDELKQKWGDADYERNTEASKRAILTLADRAGIEPDVLSHMELKNGRFLMDDPHIRQLFAPVGLEMLEGNLGPALTEGERSNITGQLETLREQIDKAQSEGNSKKANQLYAEEQRLLGKMNGDQPVVGARGRAA